MLCGCNDVIHSLCVCVCVCVLFMFFKCLIQKGKCWDVELCMLALFVLNVHGQQELQCVASAGTVWTGPSSGVWVCVCVSVCVHQGQMSHRGDSGVKYLSSCSIRLSSSVVVSSWRRFPARFMLLQSTELCLKHIKRKKSHIFWPPAFDCWKTPWKTSTYSWQWRPSSDLGCAGTEISTFLRHNGHKKPTSALIYL